MFRLEGRPRIERAIDWTTRHPMGAPFVLGLGAVAAVVAPFMITRALIDIAAIAGPLGPLVAIAVVVFAFLPYAAFVGTVVPGYVVGRSRGNGWLAAAGLVAPLAIPVAIGTSVMLGNYGGSALVAPFMLPLFFIPFWLGLRRGRASQRRLGLATAPG